jgi:sulfane dehydrogenase subunit SoxC
MKLSRRALLAGAAGAITVPKTLTMRAAQAPADPTKVPGRPTSGLGQRAVFEQPRRFRHTPSISSTPLQDLTGTVTPADLHFERHHAGVPEIDPQRYSLLIHGMVERPTVFTLADLKRFPSVSRISFMVRRTNVCRLKRAEG